MSRSLAYSLAFLASTCFAHAASGQVPAQQTSSRATATHKSQPVKVSFTGDTAPVTPHTTRTSWETSEFKPLPASEDRQKAAVILPTSSGIHGTGIHATRHQGAPNWTDSCSHCGTSGCDGYGCGFGDYANEPTKFAPGGLWVKADYLYWRMSNSNVPALVSASPFGTAQADIGVLPDAQVLFGNEPLHDDFRSGVRIQSGIWLDDCEKWGIEGEFTSLFEDNTNFFVSGDGDPAIARPFFNADPSVNGEDSRLIAFDQPDGTDELDGFVNIDSSSEFYSGGILLRRRLTQCYDSRWDFLVGYRYVSLDESLSINDQSVAQSANGQILGSVIEIRDDFSAENEFHGVDLGLAGSWDKGNWALEGMVKVALGNNQQTISIDGDTTTTIPSFAPITTSGGLLTQSTNMGTFERDEFTVVPEARASASYFLTDNIRITGGYTMIYIDNVVRSGDQIDRVVNGTLLQGPFAGPMRPEFQFDDSKVFIHGVNVGLDIMF